MSLLRVGLKTFIIFTSPVQNVAHRIPFAQAAVNSVVTFMWIARVVWKTCHAFCVRMWRILWRTGGRGGCGETGGGAPRVRHRFSTRF